MGHYKEIDKEIMKVLRESGILNHGMFFKNECNNVDQYEFPTLEIIRKFADLYNYKILYIHTKGATNESKNIAEWRRCMLYFLVERWEDCVKKLDEVDTVGIFRTNDPCDHYKGNFWWSNSNHIRKLKMPREANVPTLDGTDRHKAEFWLLSEKGEHHCPYSINKDPYSSPYEKSNYLNIKI
ncbi:MAG: hypothetical protein WCR65_01295 [Parcubacteria group bacterium]|jgi:hypothetical protein